MRVSLRRHRRGPARVSRTTGGDGGVGAKVTYEVRAGTGTLTARPMQTSARSGCHSLPKNFLRPCLLLLLREHPAHGYELVERLGPLGFGPDDHGRLYRALRRLEDDGLVASSWRPSVRGPYRRVYELTSRGAGALRDEALEIETAHHILDDFLGRCAEEGVIEQLH